MRSIRTGVEMEKLGIPTAVICTSAFMKMGKDTALSLGLDGMPIVAVPHPFDPLTPEQVERIAEDIVDEIVHVLTTSPGELKEEYLTRLAHVTDQEIALCTLPFARTESGRTGLSHHTDG